MYFIPTKNMSVNQRDNAITRFCIYFIVLVIIFGKQKEWTYLPFIAIFIIIILHMSNSQKQPIETFDNVIETGYIDSNDVLRFKRTTGEPLSKEDLSYTCRKPSVNNPFMNPVTSEYNTDAPVACNADDDEIKNDMKRSFNTNLYMDVDDVFEKVNSQRQFYTVPNTGIPNDQENFANWLYKSPQTCKEDQEQCLRYEDLRFKR
jgi:hypothetical protein